MASTDLLSLISRSNQALSQREAAIARNVANVNTPGYKTVDVKDFSEVLSSENINLARRHSAHMAVENISTASVESDSDLAETGLPTHSGNNVSLEHEMLKAGDVSAKFALGTSLYKSFHRMIATAAR